MSDPSQHPPGPPPRYKIAIVTWLGLYPMLTTLVLLLRPVLGDQPAPLQTLVISATLVPLMTYLVAPTMQRVFAGWLSKR